MDLSFLNDVELEAVKKTATKKKSTYELPTEADIRVYATGKIFPSQKFADDNSLEYQPRLVDAEGNITIVGNGIDLFSSKDWGMIKGNLPQEVLFVAVLPKNEPKVSLFGSTKYDEDNNPKNSVFAQGGGTFGVNVMLPTLTEVYGVDWTKTLYVDLKTVEQPIVSPTGIYHIPKVVSTGKKKGESTYVRRENITVNPLVISHTEPNVIDGNPTEAPAILEGTAPDPDVDPAPQNPTNWDEKLGSS